MRLRTLVTLGLAAMVLAVPAFAVQVTVPADPWNPANPGDELNLYEIYNTLYGTSFASSADLASEVVLDDRVFDFGDTDLVVEARARYAGARQQFGYYQPTGDPGAVLTELFDIGNPNSGIFAPGAYSVTINPTGEFGFYLDPEGRRASGHTWFSEDGINENEEDHLIIYRTPDANTYLLAWADLPFGVLPGEDFDFNDFVVEITINRGEVIPEPATLVLFGLGLSTLAVRRMRRKVS